MCAEHGLSAADGAPLGVACDVAAESGRGVCFAERADGRYSARAVLADLDASMPTALRTAPLLPGRWAALAPARGAGGAGVWARGALGPDGAPLAAAAAAAVRRALEAADAPAAMQLCFAPAGGAGGGLASALLQRLRDEHPDVPCIAAALAPSATSAPAPAAYSAPLCLADVAEHAALTLWVDNDAFSSVLDTAASAGTARAAQRDRLGSLNALAAAALAGASACHRLRGDAAAGGLYPPCDVAALTAALVPYPRLHLLAPALAPAPWLARRCLEAPAGGSNEGAPAEAMPQQQPLPLPPLRAGFPLEQRVVAELMAPRSLLLRAGGASPGHSPVFGGEADEPPPLRGRLLAGALLLRGDALSLPAAAAAAARCAFAAPGSLPPWATAGASPAAPLLCAASPAPAHWRIGAGGNAPPGNAGGCALLNGTFAALSLSGVAARFGAAYRRRAHVHLFTQEGLTCADLAAAAETLLDWSDEYSVFESPHDVALSAYGADQAEEGEDDGYSDEEWRGAREGPPREDEASEQDEAEEETPEAVRPAGGLARTASPPWLREALRRGRRDTQAGEGDVSTASERGSEPPRAEELS